MFSNYNYQNLSGKTSRIIKFSNTVYDDTVFENFIILLVFPDKFLVVIVRTHVKCTNEKI